MALAMPKLHNTRESGHFPSSESKSCAVQVGHRNGRHGHSGPDRQSEDPGQEAADSEAAHRGDRACCDRDAEEQPVGPHRSIDLVIPPPWPRTIHIDDCRRTSINAQPTPQSS
jgi:hypothetical protein